MNEVVVLLGYAGKAVFSVLLAAVAGVILVRTGFIRKESFRVLSTLLFYVTLPCFLFSKIAAHFDWDKVRTCWILPVSGWLFILIGLASGWLVARLTRTDRDFVRGVMTASAFGNSGYLPIPLIAAVAVIFPCFSADPNAEVLGVTYVSVYLVGFTPILWLVGYTMIAGGDFRRIRLKQIITPPVIGIFSGIAVALLPFFKDQLCSPDGWFNVGFKAVELLGTGTIPLALLVLGASFAEGPGKSTLPLRTLAGTVAIKLILLPGLALLYVLLVRRLNLGFDLMMAMVLIIECGAPSANNLVIMCNLANREIENRMAHVLFWSYLLCIITLTLFIMLTVRLLGPQTAGG